MNGDGDRTGFSVVEVGRNQYKSDLTDNGGLLAGYVSPPPVVAVAPTPEMSRRLSLDRHGRVCAPVCQRMRTPISAVS